MRFSVVFRSRALSRLRPCDVPQKLEASIAKLASWVEAHDYKGYDPGDGLNSFLRPLTFGNPARRARAAAVDLEVPVQPAAARWHQAHGFDQGPRLHGLGLPAAIQDHAGRRRIKAKAIACLDWLVANKAPGHVGYSWGNHFDFVTRSGRQSCRLADHRLDQPDRSGVPGSLRADPATLASWMWRVASAPGF